MSKYNGQSKQKQEKRVEKKKDAVGGMVAGVAGQVQKFINEWTEKHNGLAAHVNTVFSTCMQEMGKIWHNQRTFADSLDHVDANILSYAELTKDIYTRLTRLDMLCKKLEEMTDGNLLEGLDGDLAKQSAELYTEQVKAAFAIVLEKRKKEEEERQAKLEAAKAEAEAAEAAKAAEEAFKTESSTAQKALTEAESETLADVSTQGGKGQDIPEGAQVFGG